MIKIHIFFPIYIDEYSLFSYIYRLFAGEVEKARKLNLKLGVGIGLFQGLANIALNGRYYRTFWLL